MRGLLLAFAAVSFAAGQTFPSDYPYLLRLDHYAPGEHTCVLLQKTGAFHLEVDRGENVKVFEGGIEPSQVAEIQHHLDDSAFANLNQQQIDEPLLSTRRDRLQVTVFRGDGWQDLYFRSIESQQPYKSLQPLVHWLDDLHKAPHRELSEDAGKNNCLPRKPIALSKRDSPPASGSMPKIAINAASPRPVPRQPVQAAAPAGATPLLQFHLLELKQGSAHERCALVLDDGKYRLEDRYQKSGKPVNAQVLRGKITTQDVAQLGQLLDDPRLTKLKHREPPGGRYVPMMSDVLDLSIARPEGLQKIVLSSAYGSTNFPAFYGGDGDLRNANALLKFVSERLEGSWEEVLTKEDRNNCATVF